MVAITSSPPASREVVRTSIVPVTLSGADYRRAHDLCHLAAGPVMSANSYMTRTTSRFSSEKIPEVLESAGICRQGIAEVFGEL
ncbi:MAG: hypothetical protein M0008_03485 [Actinomycetota bacterium]|nr:hypothetical protein [Actinomycetota bacterium]